LLYSRLHQYFFDLLTDLELKYWRPIDIEPPDANLYIPIWGEVEISSPLSHIYFLPIVQRLSEIKQLALTDSKYPGGGHTRLEHSLGVLSIARSIIDRMLPNLGGGRSIIELGMLLHDIGHGGWGHALDGLHGYIIGLIKDDPNTMLPCIDKLDIAVAWYLLRNNDQMRSGLRRLAEELKVNPEDLEKAISLIIAEEPGLIENIGPELRQVVLYGQTILGEPRGVGGVNADRVDWVLRDTLHLLGHARLPDQLKDLEEKLEIIQAYPSNIGLFLEDLKREQYRQYEIIKIGEGDLSKVRDDLRKELYEKVYESEIKAFGDSLLLRLAFCAAKTLEAIGREVASPSLYNRAIFGYILQPDHLLRESTKKILSAASEVLNIEDPLREYIRKGYDLVGLLDVLPSIVHAVERGSSHEGVIIVSRIPYPRPDTLLAFILSGEVLFEGIEALLPDPEERLIVVQKLANHATTDPINSLNIPSMEVVLERILKDKYPGIAALYALTDYYFFRELSNDLVKLVGNIGSSTLEVDLDRDLRETLERYNRRYFLRILIRCWRKRESCDGIARELAKEVKDFFKGRLSTLIIEYRELQGYMG
jgi:hypothetical protein